MKGYVSRTYSKRLCSPDLFDTQIDTHISLFRMEHTSEKTETALYITFVFLFRKNPRSQSDNAEGTVLQILQKKILLSFKVNCTVRVNNYYMPFIKETIQNYKTFHLSLLFPCTEHIVPRDGKKYFFMFSKTSLNTNF